MVIYRHREKYSISEMCRFFDVSRRGYYDYVKRIDTLAWDLPLAEKIRECQERSHSTYGYRRVHIWLERQGIHKNPKTILRVMQKYNLLSVVRRKKYRNYGAHLHRYPNLLNRDFHADKPNEKWLTDVTEFKYYVGTEIRKLYLSAILDLYDRRIVTYKIMESNNNELVFSTFDEAVRLNPDAHPIFHSDRGFQYTNKLFHQKLTDAGMIQSMSRVGRCIDNGPMEGWWGILKSEMYYLRKFTDKTELISAIEEYITYYNTRRYQIKLSSMTPMEYHEAYAA